ncbi:MAG: response regulator transcription factor [Flavobacteriales bacterium]|jgi:two-component system LytT family response regulator|nr:response regulator transcription factor [Flavobacteriales bacterium]
MIGGVIIDDETKSREVLKFLLNELEKEIFILGEANSVKTGVELIQTKRPQVVFLDVEMLDGTGFNLLEELSEINFKLIFITAYDSYAIQAFKYSAVDYILKPIDTEELESAVDRTIQLIEKEISNNYQIKALLNNISHDTKKQVAISSSNKINIVNEDEVVCLLADGNYTEVIVDNIPKIISTKPLKYFNNVFENNGDFFRISKSCIVNKRYIRAFNKAKSSIELYNEMELEVSRRRKKDFIQELNMI